MKIKIEEVQGLTIDQKHYKCGEVTDEISVDFYNQVIKNNIKHSVVSDKPVNSK